MEVFDGRIIDSLLEQAHIHPRKRKATALKPANYEGPRPLLNAMLPGTYCQPHRHNDERIDEYWLVLRGTIGSFSFAEEGTIKDHKIVSPTNGFPFVYLPSREYHTLVVVDEPSVILELTQGPYDPNTYKEFAPWAPSEDQADEERAKDYLRDLESRLK